MARLNEKMLVYDLEKGGINTMYTPECKCSDITFLTLYKASRKNKKKVFYNNFCTKTPCYVHCVTVKETNSPTKEVPWESVNR